VTSIVEDLVMPVIGKIIGNVDFTNLYYPLSEKITAGMTLTQAKAVGPVIAYGNFITILINFLIVAFCIFLVVKAIMKAMPKKKEEPAPK
jgi:large conductance mechanosensitive channel